MSFDILQKQRRWSPLSTDPDTLDRHFGDSGDLLPLWIAEPYVPLAPAIVTAISERAASGWYGYQTRPEEALGAFWEWMERRHQWPGSELLTSVSPSVGTSIAALIEMYSEPGDGVILQPPVFTDFKPLIRRHERTPVRNPLLFEDGPYTMDVDGLAALASEPANRMLILCNPHNPVGRVWDPEELRAVAEICSRNDVVVVADEIHADLALPPDRFVPFATAAEGSEVRWAATHGPIKTFGIAGVADTLLITDDEALTEQYRSLSKRFHLTRNNVFSLAAIQAGYSAGDDWLDGLLDLVSENLRTIESELPDGIDLVRPEATYLAWLDFRQLGMDVPELATWLAREARLALSPGHWFGREGAGFARMTVAVEPAVVEDAMDRLRSAVHKWFRI